MEKTTGDTSLREYVARMRSLTKSVTRRNERIHSKTESTTTAPSKQRKDTSSGAAPLARSK